MRNLKLKKLLLIIMLFTGVYSLLYLYIKENNKEYMLVYTVQESDTLWSIASNYTNKLETRNSLVSKIQFINDINHNIYPGEKLLIPIRI